MGDAKPLAILCNSMGVGESGEAGSVNPQSAQKEQLDFLESATTTKNPFCFFPQWVVNNLLSKVLLTALFYCETVDAFGFTKSLSRFTFKTTSVCRLHGSIVLRETRSNLDFHGEEHLGLCYRGIVSFSFCVLSFSEFGTKKADCALSFNFTPRIRRSPLPQW